MLPPCMACKPGIHGHAIKIDETRPMKRRTILVVVVIALWVSGCSTATKQKQAAVQDTPSLVAKNSTYILRGRLYDHSWDWLAKTFPGDTRQVQSADRKEGKIVAIGTRDINIAYQQNRPLRFRLRFELTQGFYALTMDQAQVMLEGSWLPVDGPRNDVLGPQVERLFKQLAASYSDYLEPYDVQRYPSDPDLQKDF